MMKKIEIDREISHLSTVLQSDDYKAKIYAVLYLQTRFIFELEDDEKVYLFNELYKVLKNQDIAARSDDFYSVLKYIEDSLPDEYKLKLATSEGGAGTVEPWLPPELDTPTAKKYLKRAVDMGYVKITGTGYKWVEGYQLLACFAQSMSEKLELGKGCNSNGSQRISWKPFEQLFEIKKGKLRSNLNDMQKTGCSPFGIELLDRIFE